MGIYDTLLKFVLDEVKYRFLRAQPDPHLVRKLHIRHQEMQSALQDLIPRIRATVVERRGRIMFVSDLLDQYYRQKNASSTSELFNGLAFVAERHKQVVDALFSFLENTAAFCQKRASMIWRRHRDIVFLMETRSIEGEYKDLRNIAFTLGGGGSPMHPPLYGLRCWARADQDEVILMLRAIEQRHTEETLTFAEALRWGRHHGDFLGSGRGHDPYKSYDQYHEDWRILVERGCAVITECVQLLEGNMATLSRIAESLAVSNPSREPS